MRLEFQSIELQNFKAFADGPHLLDLKSLGVGLHFVIGENHDEPELESNGSSKSSLISDSLCWCLYGRTTSGEKSTDILPWSGKKPAVVVVQFTVDGIAHFIERWAGPNKLKLDGKEVSQAEIDSILQMSYLIFTQAILLGQDKDLFFDLEPKDQMNLFVEVLTLDRWDERAEKASKKLTELVRLEAAGEGELGGLRQGSLTLEKLLSEARKGAETWSSSQNARLKSLEHELLAAREAQDAAEREHAEFDLAFDGASTELKALEAEWQKLASVREGVVAERTHAAVEALVTESEIKRLQQELLTLGETDSCPVCGQSIKGTDFANHKQELQKKLTSLQKLMWKWQKELKVLNKDAAEITERLSKSNKEQQAFKKKAEQARTLLDVKSNNVFRARAAAGSIQDQLKIAKEQINPYREQTTQLQKKLNTYRIEIDELEELLKELKIKIEKAKFWVKGFKEVRLLLLEEVLQELEMTTNAMLEEVGLHDWIIKFDIERETKSKTISHGLTTTILSPRSKKGVKWVSWSGGEGQRLRVISALALGEVLLNYAGVQTNLEILDEPTTFIGGKGVQDLCEYLSNRAEVLGKQIFLIDHVARQSTFFTSTIKVVKTKEGARICM